MGTWFSRIIGVFGLSLCGCSVVLSTDGYTTGCTDLPTPAGYDSSQLVFEDNFCGSALDSTKWSTYVPGFNDGGHLQPPLSGPNAGGMESEYWAPSQVTTSKGLTLAVAPDATQPGFSARSGIAFTTMQFDGGGATGHTYIRVRAKLPARDGMWGGVELNPPSGSSATSVVLLGTGFAIGTTPPTDAIDMKVGPVDGSGDSESHFDAGVDLSTVYADYGVEVVWGESVTWTWSPIDGAVQQTYQALASDGIAVPSAGDQETLGIHLRVLNGLDGSEGWHTVWNGTDSDAFAIQAVEVYER